MKKKIAGIMAAVIAFTAVVGIGIGIGIKSPKEMPEHEIKKSSFLYTPSSYEEIYKRMYPRESLFDVLFGRRKRFPTVYVINEQTVFTETADVKYNGTYNSFDFAAKNDTYSGTNVQEVGVDEADLIKTDGKYIYYLAKDFMGKNKVVILSVAGDKIEQLSTVKIDDNMYINEIYVDDDRMVLVGDEYSDGNLTYYSANTMSVTLTYDITDRADVKYIDKHSQSGSYVSSRKIGDMVYLISSHVPYRYWYCYNGNQLKKWNDDMIDEFAPSCDGEILRLKDVKCIDNVNYAGFTVIGSVDIKDGKNVDIESVTVNPNDIYVSADAIYIACYRSCDTKEYDFDGEKYEYETCPIIKYGFNKGKISYIAENLVPGYVDNQFSFSEQNGYLRVVTTGNRYNKYVNERVSGLYIYDVDMKMVGAVSGLAKGEEIKSSRYIGNIAYMVTFKRTDPLFAIDVTDPTNPIILDELKIPGFSEYMHPYSNDRLLGIGYDADENTGRTKGIKLSMFDISDPTKLSEEDLYCLGEDTYSEVLYNHKALMIDVNRNLFGFVTQSYDYDTYEYILTYRLFTYDNGFKELITYDLDNRNGDNYYWYYSDDIRSLYINDTLYIINMDEVVCFDLTNYSYMSSFVIQ